MCLICERIEMIKRNENPYFVKELKTGYVVIGDHQHFRGYTLFLCKQHVTELHLMEPSIRTMFLEEMALTAEAVCMAFKPEKLNYEMLGNGEAHMHWHLFPRITGDTPKSGPVWWLPYEQMYDDACRPSAYELEQLKYSLLIELEKIC